MILPHPRLVHGEGGRGIRERGQAGGPIGISGQRESPRGGPHRSVSLPRCHGGSTGSKHQRYV